MIISGPLDLKKKLFATTHRHCEDSVRRLRRPAVPLLVTVTALAFAVSGCSLSDQEVDKGVQCVIREDPNSTALDDVRVTVVDPSYCDEDRNDGYYGPYFISTGGGYYGVPVGTTYVHSSSKDGGSPLIRSNDATARANAKVPSRFTGKTTVGRATVKSGGFGSGRAGGG